MVRQPTGQAALVLECILLVMMCGQVSSASGGVEWLEPCPRFWGWSTLMNNYSKGSSLQLC
jgi:hypothetical protein